MTKKDYELIAKEIKKQFDFFGENEPTLYRLAVYMSAALQEENPLFDHAKFMGACGIPVAD